MDDVARVVSLVLGTERETGLSTALMGLARSEYTVIGNGVFCHDASDSTDLMLGIPNVTARSEYTVWGHGVFCHHASDNTALVVLRPQVTTMKTPGPYHREL
jgi:hypothetical protein